MTVEIKMPRLGVNDEYVTLVSWAVEDGAAVSAGQILATIETTKETSELVCEVAGYIHFLVEADTEVRVNSVVAVVTDTKDYQVEQAASALEGVKITAKAQALIDANDVDISSLAGLSIIREKDVLALLAPANEIVRSKANDVVVVCGGNLAKMSIDLLKLNKAYNICGYVDDIAKPGDSILGVSLLGPIDRLADLRKEGYVVAINTYGSIVSDNTDELFFARKNLFERIKEAGFILPTLIHPSAAISESAQLGEGVLVFENASVGPQAQIADDCIINTGAIVSHDCKICAHARISPGAVLAGNVTIGENTLVGMGVTIFADVTIGKNVIIANGQNIMGNIPDNAVIK